MSTVYLCTDLHLQKYWALKEIPVTADPLSGSSENKPLPEAELMKKLDHPSLPRIVDIFRNEHTVCIVMDYIEGQSLDKILAERGPLPCATVVSWGISLCHVLQYLHSQDPPIIFRDIKPSNIMLTRDGQIKVIDFGIAREYKEETDNDTRILGTKGYASPEHYGRRQTDIRSDIYSLGMTLHHLITGADPRSPLYQYKGIRSYDPKLPAGLEQVINTCVSIDPKDRYQNCEELLFALHHYPEDQAQQKKRKKRKLLLFQCSIFLSVLCLALSLTFHSRSTFLTDSYYEDLTQISPSTPYDTRISTYLQAISIKPQDPTAYLLLLQTYQDQQKFGEAEGQQFTSVFNTAFSEAPACPSDQLLQLYYEAGITYFYLYSGEDDQERSRIQNAHTYFLQIHNSSSESFPQKDLAESYYRICEFYRQYIFHTVNIVEPDREAYDSLLLSLRQCLQQIQKEETTDHIYYQLTLYQMILNLLENERFGFYEQNIPEKDLLFFSETIEQNCQSLQTSHTLSPLREKILQLCLTFQEDLRQIYE